MAVEIAKIDKYGRIKLPRLLRQRLRLVPDTEIKIEITNDGIIIKPGKSRTPITDAIAKMNLPVAEWEQMERESIVGRTCE